MFVWVGGGGTLAPAFGAVTPVFFFFMGVFFSSSPSRFPIDGGFPGGLGPLFFLSFYLSGRSIDGFRKVIRFREI